MDDFQQKVLRDLIAIDTTNPPGNEEAAACYLADLLAPMGFETRLQAIAPGRANLIARLDCGEGPVLALCGHLDVVAADPAHWDSDPFVLREQGGRLYGRGTVDMKGAVSAMAAAAKELAAQRESLRGTLLLLFVADEEVHTGGTKTFLAEGNRPDAVLIGEPTDMEVCVAHRGTTRCVLEFTGCSGHASMPDKARNPITDAARFVLEVEEQNRRLSAVSHPVLPPPTMAATVIGGGEQTNTIPGSCRVTVDRRTFPGETRESLLAELEEMFARAGIQQRPKVDFFVEVAAGELRSDSGLGERCGRVLRAMGLGGRLRDFGASCDQFAFTGAGVDCVVVGPGSLGQAHVANEYIEKEQLALARDFYIRFAREELAQQ